MAQKPILDFPWLSSSPRYTYAPTIFPLSARISAAGTASFMDLSALGLSPMNSSAMHLSGRISFSLKPSITVSLQLIETGCIGRESAGAISSLSTTETWSVLSVELENDIIRYITNATIATASTQIQIGRFGRFPLSQLSSCESLMRKQHGLRPLRLLGFPDFLERALPMMRISLSLMSSSNIFNIVLSPLLNSP